MRADDAATTENALRDANAALERGETGEALAHLDRAASADPHDEELPLLAATIRLREGDPLQAAHLAARSLAIRPFHPAAVNALAVACIDALQPELALKLLRRGLELAPAMTTFTDNLAAARERKRAIRAARVSRDEIARARELLPRAAITAWLERTAPSLDACVLVDDADADRLPACLDAVRPLAGRLVIVDARSADAALPAVDAEVERVRVTPGTERAAARGAGWRRCRGDWIVTLHAGETWNVEPAALRAALDTRGALAWPVTVLDAGGALRLDLRLCRNAAGVTASGAIEPGPGASLIPLEGRLGLAVQHTPVGRIVGSGPVPTVDAETARRAVDARLALDGDDPRALLDRAWLDLDGGRAADALDAARRARRALAAETGPDRAPFLEEPTVLLSTCLLRNEQPDAAAELLDEYHEHCPLTANTGALRGAAASAAGESERASTLLTRALAADDLPAWAPRLREAEAARVSNLLGALALDRRDLAAARAGFDAALALDADDLEARLGLVTVRYAEGQLEGVLTELDALIESAGDDERVWNTGAILLGNVPELADATVAWLEEARRRFPERRDLRESLGDAWLRAGEPERALAAWDDAPAQAGDRIAARVTAALACGATLPDTDPGAAAAAAREVPAWLARLAAFGAWQPLDRVLMELHRAEPVIPGVVRETATWLERAGQAGAAEGLRQRVAAS